MLKIVIIGDVKVGKTSIRLRYLGEGFRSQYISTLGSDFAIKRIGEYQLQIWDLAGQMSFKSIIKNYYRGAHALILVFDLTREDTLRNIPMWIEDFKSAETEIVTTLVIGNKIDLRSQINPGVDTVSAIKFVAELSKKYSQKIQYIETSASTGENIDVAFEEMVAAVEEQERKQVE